MLVSDRVVPDNWDWETELLDLDEGPDSSHASDADDGATPDSADGAVAEGQSGTASPNAMQEDAPPKAPPPPRPLRIAKKPKPNNNNAPSASRKRDSSSYGQCGTT